ncbi:MAG: GNAT family N-acetyltransferase [Hyphomicrobiales bacterium]|nr:GNAT family N-acetyltransferase [Hyphomicrobiales bacterium]
MGARVVSGQAPVVALDGAASAIASARRAVVADRYAADALAVEWRRLDQLSSIADDWRDLAERSVEPNIFYEPSFARAAVPVFGKDAGAILVWSKATPRRLLGFFPSRIETRRYGVKLPVLVGWTHPYAPLGVPLVETGGAEPIIAAWLAHIAADASLPGLLVLPFLPEAGAFAAALSAILRRARMPFADFNHHQRALLQPNEGQQFDERPFYVEQSLGQHQHKELRRHWRRLSDAGAILFTVATERAPVAAALEDFFSLEAGGWKGRVGTAAAGDDSVRRFVGNAVEALAAEGGVAIERILVDGRAIAAAIILRSGRFAWFWKIAYDERFARFSPGVMLSVVVTDDLLDDLSIASTDSCATAHHPMIDHLWRERLALCDRVVAVRPQAPFALAHRLERLRATGIAGARHLRGLLPSNRNYRRRNTIR